MGPSRGIDPITLHTIKGSTATQLHSPHELLLPIFDMHHPADRIGHNMSLLSTNRGTLAVTRERERESERERERERGTKYTPRPFSWLERQPCRHYMGYSFRLAGIDLLYAPSHGVESTYRGLCFTSRGALAGTRNNRMGPS